MDINSGEIIDHCILNMKQHWKSGLYTRSFIYKNKYISVPWNSKSISIYNLSTNLETIIDIPEISMATCQYGFFRTAVLRESYLYAFGVNYPGIIRLDLELEQAECIVKLSDISVDNSGFLEEMVILDDVVYIPLKNKNIVALFNVKDESIQMIDIGNYSSSPIQSICYDNNNTIIIVVFDGGEVYFFDKKLKKGIKNDSISQTLINHIPIRHSAYYKDNIFFFPEDGDVYIRYSLISKNNYLVRLPFRNNGQSFYYVRTSKDELSFFCEKDKMLYKYNEEKNQFEASDKQLTGNQFFQL